MVSDELPGAPRSLWFDGPEAPGAGVTGHSTAKLSSLQGSTYAELEGHFGAAGAAGYAVAAG